VITVRSWLSLTSKFILHFSFLSFPRCMIILHYRTNIMFLFSAFDTFVIKVDGGHQPGKRRVLKHHTTYHVKQQPLGNSCGFFICINMLCFGSQPFTNVSVNLFICTLLSSFIFTYAFHLLLIHFSYYIVVGLCR
jgi:hypothetical protein